MRFQQMKPKEFKTLMLIYFLSISTQMFLSKSILTGISLLLPAIWNSRENSQKKVFLILLLSSHVRKKKISFPWGKLLCQVAIYYIYTVGTARKEVIVLDFPFGQNDT